MTQPVIVIVVRGNLKDVGGLKQLGVFANY